MLTAHWNVQVCCVQNTFPCYALVSLCQLPRKHDPRVFNARGTCRCCFLFCSSAKFTPVLSPNCWEWIDPHKSKDVYLVMLPSPGGSQMCSWRLHSLIFMSQPLRGHFQNLLGVFGWCCDLFCLKKKLHVHVFVQLWRWQLPRKMFRLFFFFGSMSSTVTELRIRCKI